MSGRRERRIKDVRDNRKLREARDATHSLDDVGDVGAIHHLHPSERVARVREGGGTGRPSSPAWDLTVLRVRRADKARFDLLRVSRSWDGRVRPHWEVFAEMLDEAENT